MPPLRVGIAQMQQQRDKSTLPLHLFAAAARTTLHKLP
jgi:hypothetical protein